jgi:pyruvate dehydrogenase E2 component (dihydrolipoamide acetyltransferase)
MAMEEGKIIKWLVREGDNVEAGAPLLEIETDKVSMEIEATVSGTLLKILAHEGDTVPVIQTIGYIGQPGEEIPEEEQKTAEEPVKEKKIVNRQPSRIMLEKGKKIPATPLAKTLAKQRGISLDGVVPSGYYGEVKARDIAAAKTVKATPLAKKMAADAGVSLGEAKTKGRITSKDIQAVIDAAGANQKDSPPVNDGDVVKPLSGMRKTIASRMFQSHIEIPSVTMDTKADVTGLLAERKRVNAAGAEKISINDYVVQACAHALAEMPEANISFGGDSVIYRKHVNVGVAVALAQGLIVPVIKDADMLSLEGISKSVKMLADKARNGKLTPDEYTGGTFTVSNLGMYGVTFFTPIINQPESMILGVCAVEKVLKMDDEGTIQNRDIMGLSLTFDHRAHDGASAAVFLRKIVEKLEAFNADI